MYKPLQRKPTTQTKNKYQIFIALVSQLGRTISVWSFRTTDFSAKCVRYPYDGEEEGPTINLALLGTGTGHYRVIDFEEATANELLYQHFVDLDNVMDPIGTPQGEYILTQQELIHFVRVKPHNKNLNEISSDDSEWSGDEILDLQFEEPMYSDTEREGLIEEKTQFSLFANFEKTANKQNKKTGEQTNSMFNKKNTLFESFENTVKQEEDKKKIKQKKNIFKKKSYCLFDSFEKTVKQEEKKEREKIKKKPLYYVHMRGGAKKCLFCGISKNTTPINHDKGRDLFFMNRLLVYPQHHHCCSKCNKKHWATLKVHPYYRRTKILSTAHINLIERYLLSLRNIYENKKHNRTNHRQSRYVNNINIENINKQQCKRLTKIQLQHIKEMALETGIPFKHCFIFWYYLGNTDSWEKACGIFGPSSSTLNTWYKNAKTHLFTWSKKINNPRVINREYIKKNTNTFTKIALQIEDKPDTAVVMMDSFSIKIQHPSTLYVHILKLNENIFCYCD